MKYNFFSTMFFFSIDLFTSRKKNIPMSALTLMVPSGVLLVFLPVRLDVAKASRPKITTARSWVNTDIFVLDNRSNVFLGIVTPPPRAICKKKKIVSEVHVHVNNTNSGLIK